MLIDLAGKTALVTGSTQGIGAAIAAGLARAGARVAGNGRGEEPTATAAVAGLMVVYLSSPQASATTGGVLRVDGGYIDAILP